MKRARVPSDKLRRQRAPGAGVPLQGYLVLGVAVGLQPLSRHLECDGSRPDVLLQVLVVYLEILKDAARRRYTDLRRRPLQAGHLYSRLAGALDQLDRNRLHRYGGRVEGHGQRATLRLVDRAGLQRRHAEAGWRRCRLWRGVVAYGTACSRKNGDRHNDQPCCPGHHRRLGTGLSFHSGVANASRIVALCVSYKQVVGLRKLPGGSAQSPGSLRRPSSVASGARESLQGRHAPRLDGTRGP